MPTLGDIKIAVATQLGATDGTSSVPKRDRQINRARRKYYSDAKWSFCFKTEDLTVTSQQITLPTVYNKKFDPEAVYSYTATTKYEFEKVAWDDLAAYSTGSYVYAINKQTGKIKINQTTFSTITLDYYQLPADAAIDTTGDSTTELAPDTTAIEYLATGYWWLTSERSLAKYQLFKDEYKEQLAEDKKQDMVNRPVKPVRVLRRALGYNRGSVARPRTGYVGGGY